MTVGRWVFSARTSASAGAPGESACVPAPPYARHSAGRSTRGRSAAVGVSPRVHLVADLAVSAAVEHDDRERQSELCRCHQFLHGELQPAVVPRG